MTRITPITPLFNKRLIYGKPEAGATPGTPTLPPFVVFPCGPALLDTILGTATTSQFGVLVAGHYAYVAGYSTVAGGTLTIFDITDASDLQQVGQITSTSLDGEALAHRDGVIFMGGASNGVVSVDVSDPTDPQIMQALTTGMGFVYTLDLFGDLLVGSAYTPESVISVDVSDPENMVLLDVLTDAGIDNPSGIKFNTAGTHAFVACTGGASTLLTSISVADPNNLAVADVYNGTFDEVGADGPQGLIVRSDDMIFVAAYAAFGAYTSDISSGALTVFDGSDPTDIQPAGIVPIYDAQGVTITDSGLIVVSGYATETVTVVDPADLTQLMVRAKITAPVGSAPNTMWSVDSRADLAFVAEDDSDATLHSFNVLPCEPEGLDDPVLLYDTRNHPAGQPGDFHAAVVAKSGTPARYWPLDDGPAGFANIGSGGATFNGVVTGTWNELDGPLAPGLAAQHAWKPGGGVGTIACGASPVSTQSFTAFVMMEGLLSTGARLMSTGGPTGARWFMFTEQFDFGGPTFYKLRAQGYNAAGTLMFDLSGPSHIASSVSNGPSVLVALTVDQSAGTATIWLDGYELDSQSLAAAGTFDSSLTFNVASAVSQLQLSDAGIVLEAYDASDWADLRAAAGLAPLVNEGTAGSVWDLPVRSFGSAMGAALHAGSGLRGEYPPGGYTFPTFMSSLGGGHADAPYCGMIACPAFDHDANFIFVYWHIENGTDFETTFLEAGLDYNDGDGYTLMFDSQGITPDLVWQDRLLVWNRDFNLGAMELWSVDDATETLMFQASGLGGSGGPVMDDFGGPADSDHSWFVFDADQYSESYVGELFWAVEEHDWVYGYDRVDGDAWSACIGTALFRQWSTTADRRQWYEYFFS